MGLFSGNKTKVNDNSVDARSIQAGAQVFEGTGDVDLSRVDNSTTITTVTDFNSIQNSLQVADNSVYEIGNTARQALSLSQSVAENSNATALAFQEQSTLFAQNGLDAIFDQADDGLAFAESSLQAANNTFHKSLSAVKELSKSSETVDKDNINKIIMVGVAALVAVVLIARVK